MDLFDFKEVKYLERDTSTPTFSGTVPSEIGKGGQMLITVGDKTVSVDINPADGSWSWTPSTPLEDGHYNMSFQSIDKAGNPSTPTLRTLIVDTTPPAAPTLLNMYDDQGDITGSFDSGKMTDDRRPTLTGIAEKGVIVYLKEGDKVIGSAKADEKTGMWTIEPLTDLTDGQHDLTLVASETFAGKLREGEPSDEFTIIIGKDGEVPVDPGGVAKIIDAIDNVGSVTGSLKSGGITDDITPELRGSAPQGSVVRIQYRNDKGEWIDGGNAVMNGTSWSWTPDPALGAGNWEFRANAGSGWTDEFKLDIDLAPAGKTEITHAYDDFGPFTGMLGNGAITDDRTPNLHGRAESNSVVYIHYRNVLGAWELLDSVTAGADGRWEYGTDRLPVGIYEFQAGSSVGNDGNSKPFKLNIISENNTLPIIDEVYDDVGLSTGFLKSGDKTDDTRPQIKGSAEANSVVKLEISNKTTEEIITTTILVNDKGYWDFTPSNDLTKGQWEIKVGSENSEIWSNTFDLNIYDIVEKEIITENFSGFKTGVFNGPLKINGANILFDKGVYTEILNKHGSVHLKVGKDSYYYNGKITIELDSLASDASLRLLGLDSKTTISTYDKFGNVIETIQVTQAGWKQFSFKSAQNFISKIVIESRDDISGLNIDDITYTKVDEKNSISSNDENKAFLHDEPGIMNLNEDRTEITVEDILNHGIENFFIDDAKIQLMIEGVKNKTVLLKDILPENEQITTWTEQTGTITIAGTQYHVFSHGDAELLVQDGVTVNLV
ncbi:Ig-like domain-containing protein [Pantoea dispersa]|uniref:Ig-like domain-containing protein n=1 Tax=Pantoea dispersa TaxID=59814 RepID=UPI002DB665AA|nr:Ig-like domain-containing protein [Pantoea dispersa]MEB5972785.1 Ig-like domain-containing protein [Pantoea dispersa]